LRLAQQAISLDPNFSAAYGLILDSYVKLRDAGWMTIDDIATEGKQYAFRAIEVGADDAYTLARASNFFSTVLNDLETADVIADQAIAVNPNLSEAWRMRGYASAFLGRYEPALEQFHYAMRLNPLDPQIYFVETGLGWANFFLRRFEVALSWAAKSMARNKNFEGALAVAIGSYAMLGRIADAQMMRARWREAGFPPATITQIRKRMRHFRDFELYLEACRIIGTPE
jgi:adenylate cyclase